MQTLGKTEGEISKSLMERIVFETAIQYQPRSKTKLSGLSCNLSIGGLYLRTDYPLDIDETLELSFSLPGQDSEATVSCSARVAWTNFAKNRCKPDYASGVGLQFLDISRENLSALSTFVRGNAETKGMNVVCAWCGSYLGIRKGPFGATSHGICNQCCESVNLD